MKNSKAILLAIFASVFAVLTVVNMSMASPKSAGENTLDMLEIMTRAFDESEGGEDPGGDCEITVTNSDGLATFVNAKKNFWGQCRKRCDWICVKRDFPDIP